MNRKKIELADCMNEALINLPHGILLTSKANGKVNSMVIGWGTPGILWGKPVFMAYVRTGRYTRELLDANPEFTINIPTDNIDSKIIQVCGYQSGRSIDKIKEAGLTLAEPEIISVPAIKELPLTLECRVLYRQVQDLNLLNNIKLKNALYPEDVDSSNPRANRDAHVMYVGEILSSYIVE